MDASRRNRDVQKSFAALEILTDSPSTSPLDLLAIGAHPDDVELFAGGTLALLNQKGYRVGILHMTRGECGTRGTPETRMMESQAAAQILGAKKTITLDLGDGRLENSQANRQIVVGVIRKLKPRVVMTHYHETRHPDHHRAHELVRDACFLANVGGFDPATLRHKVSEVVYYLGHEGRTPVAADWIVDVSETYETKIRALRAYETQFHAPGKTDSGPQTYLSSPEFWESQENWSRRWGHLIGARHGEPFIFQHPPHANHALVKMLADGAK